MVYQDNWIHLRVDDVVRPDGNPGTYSVVGMKGGIGAVVRDEAARILLVGQFRYTVDRYSWEIPKGAFESFNHDEDPLATAKRELEEETGVIGINWVEVGVVHTLLGSSDDEVFLFAADKGRSVPPRPEGTEDLQIRWVTNAEVWKMIDMRKITDATSIAAIALVDRRMA